MRYAWIRPSTLLSCARSVRMNSQPPMQQPEQQPSLPPTQWQPPQSQSLPPTQWQPPQSQPLPPPAQWSPQQPPWTPPPQMMAPQHPPKRSGRILWIMVAIVAVVVAFFSGLAIGANSKSSGTTSGGSNPGATATTGPTATATAHPGNHQVGETVNYNNHWQITINSVSSYQGDPSQFDPTPAPGDTFLVIEGTFKNLQSTAQPLSTDVDFELRDSQGNNYDEAFLPSLNMPDGTIPPGGPAHGKWGYEVPTSAHTFTLLFSEDFGETSAIWDISLP